MATRTKTVFSGAEIDHVWAHQKATSGRCSGKNVFFDGPVIFSYGRHFPMARLVGKGGKPLKKDEAPAAVLITTRKYSVSTASHQSDVRSAVRHLPQFHVDDVLSGVKQATRLAEYRRRIKAKAESAQKAKANTLYAIDRLKAEIAEANRYAEFHGLATRFGYPEGFSLDAEMTRGEAEQVKADERQRKREERADARYKEQQARNAVKLIEDVKEFERKVLEHPAKLEAWLAGKTNDVPYYPKDPRLGWSEQNREQRERNEVRLRVRGIRIETTLGAVFEIEAAKPLLRLVQLPIEDKVVNREDMEVSGYRGVTIDYPEKTVRVGCHTVKFAEVERIARQLKLWEEPCSKPSQTSGEPSKDSPTPPPSE